MYDRLVEMLEECEFAALTEHDEYCCIECDALLGARHDQDCQLAKLLAEARAEK